MRGSYFAGKETKSLHFFTVSGAGVLSECGGFGAVTIVVVVEVLPRTCGVVVVMEWGRRGGPAKKLSIGGEEGAEDDEDEEEEELMTVTSGRSARVRGCGGIGRVKSQKRAVGIGQKGEVGNGESSSSVV